ncbi:hypothetical protein BY996DRAFT_6799136 [Phakopsora pachyrhizi]|nr:hypothetical protein BY996DRAFT_6799136 [Phakopsora pachyrhizi]
MKLLDKLDVGAKSWQAHPTVIDSNGLMTKRSGGSLRRQASISRLDIGKRLEGSSPSPEIKSNKLSGTLQRKLFEDQSRKLKEQRLIELTKQLDPNYRPKDHHHQQSNNPNRSTLSNPTILRPSSVASHNRRISSPEASFAHLEEAEILKWRRKKHEIDELNSRIESLKLSGLPPDQLPSPVLFPSTPLLQDISIQKNSKLSRSSPQVKPTSHLINQSFDSDPRLQQTRRMVTPTPSSNIQVLKLPSSSPGNKNGVGMAERSKFKTENSQKTIHDQSIKATQELINDLRSSNEKLLTRLDDMKKEMGLKEVENQDLRIRIDRLETWLSEEQKIKVKLESENQQLRSQLNSKNVVSNAHSNKNSGDKFLGGGNESARNSSMMINSQNVLGGAYPREMDGQDHPLGRLPNTGFGTNDPKSSQIRAYLSQKDATLNKKFSTPLYNDTNLYSEPNYQNMHNQTPSYFYNNLNSQDQMAMLINQEPNWTTRGQKTPMMNPEDCNQFLPQQSHNHHKNFDNYYVNDYQQQQLYNQQLNDYYGSKNFPSEHHDAQYNQTYSY